MRVHTQLIAAFLGLAVVPLAGIVLYSYSSSQRAFRQAVEEEIRELAEDTGARLDEVRDELDRRLERLGKLPVRALLPGAVDDAASRAYSDLMAQLGEAEDLVDFFEFTPASASAAALPGVDAESPAAIMPEPFFIYPSKTLAMALEKVQRREVTLEALGISEEIVDQMLSETIKERWRLDEAELQALEASQAETRALLGREFTIPVMRDDQLLGYLEAQVPAAEILRQVLSRTAGEKGEIPFARDRSGTLYVGDSRDKAIVSSLLGGAGGPAAAPRKVRDWIVVETPDPKSPLTFGIARPIQQSLREIRRTAVRNLAYGLGMIVLALAGIVLLSSRMTRNLRRLTAGAERLAEGDLRARVPVRSRDEFGTLASTFNRMARELNEKRKQLIEQERLRREEEVERRLLEAENERKSRELEEARQFQLSLLPKELPVHPCLDVAVHMQTATEVGGDYYDFFPAEAGELTAVIGDATGHGARAGTMVTVIKGLLTAGAGQSDLSRILGDATRAIKSMELGRMNMAVTLVRLRDDRITISAAGMPPALLYRVGTGRVEEIDLPGTPLGSLADVRYEVWESSLAPGDTLLLLSDGFPELLNDGGEPLGYPRVRSFFEAAARKAPREIIAELSAAARHWNGGRPPDDDMTFVVLKMKAA